ncbi:MAG: 50S ribosomal protein L15 [Actinobacteria bacterium]|nr:50S ribosomal protein L15 [Actinomycetota bacterium]MCL6087291.1 50S ribosomal protein L15 [Actinomycetota bacterium]
MVNLNDLGPAYGSVKNKKRVGRGNASGHGTTSGRGSKGQLSRSGGKSKTRLGFEGGQMPLNRRIPHLKGFKNTRKKEFNIINLNQLEKFDEGFTVDFDALVNMGMIMDRDNKVKILGNGSLTKKLIIKADCFSKSAIEKIEKAGGKAEAI